MQCSMRRPPLPQLCSLLHPPVCFATQMLLADLQRNDAGFRANRARYLEHRDENGNTPLTL